MIAKGDNDLPGEFSRLANGMRNKAVVVGTVVNNRGDIHRIYADYSILRKSCG